MNKKILVVEDDADVLRGYQVLLKHNHYNTFFAADAIGAGARLANGNPI